MTSLRAIYNQCLEDCGSRIPIDALCPAFSINRSSISATIIRLCVFLWGQRDLRISSFGLEKPFRTSWGSSVIPGAFRRLSPSLLFHPPWMWPKPVSPRMPISQHTCRKAVSSWLFHAGDKPFINQRLHKHTCISCHMECPGLCYLLHGYLTVALATCSLY